MGESSAKNIPYGIHGMGGGIHPFHMESIWKIPGSVKTSSVHDIFCIWSLIFIPGYEILSF
jgi:hypothetical protein